MVGAADRYMSPAVIGAALPSMHISDGLDERRGLNRIAQPVASASCQPAAVVPIVRQRADRRLIGTAACPAV
jgi:hypothetical protein